MKSFNQDELNTQKKTIEKNVDKQIEKLEETFTKAQENIQASLGRQIKDLEIELEQKFPKINI